MAFAGKFLPSFSLLGTLSALVRRATKKKTTKPRNGERRTDRRKALEWHRLALKGVYTERRRMIRRVEDRQRCKYDPWYTFYEFNPQLREGEQRASAR